MKNKDGVKATSSDEKSGLGLIKPSPWFKEVFRNCDHYIHTYPGQHKGLPSMDIVSDSPTS